MEALAAGLLDAEPADARLLVPVSPVAMVLNAVVLVAKSLNVEMLDAEVPDAELLAI